MVALFKHYIPGRKYSIGLGKGDKLSMKSILCIGLILCQGKITDKADCLFELFQPPELGQDQE